MAKKKQLSSRKSKAAGEVAAEKAAPVKPSSKATAGEAKKTTPSKRVRPAAQAKPPAAKPAPKPPLPALQSKFAAGPVPVAKPATASTPTAKSPGAPVSSAVHPAAKAPLPAPLAPAALKSSRAAADPAAPAMPSAARRPLVRRRPPAVRAAAPKLPLPAPVVTRLKPGAAVPPLPPASKPVAAPFSGPEPRPADFVDRGLPIPDSYGLDRLVALVRDPQWAFCYWELSGGLLDGLRQARGPGFLEACAWVLRLHRISEGVAVDLEIDPSVGNWYIHVGKSGRYQFELGLLTPDGEWVSLLASQEFETPAEGPSESFDEEWRLRPEDEERLHRLLLKELGLEGDARARGFSGFLGASVLPSSWRLAGSFLGASWGGSASGRPVAGSWAWSFQGASGRPSSPGSGGFMNVGWIVGTDGRHEPVLVRPTRGGGPNWHFQAHLPAGRRTSKTDAPHFQVKLPRVVQGAPRPAPSWPPRSRPASLPTATVKPAGAKTAKPLGSSGR